VSRADATAIWTVGVDAVAPELLLNAAVAAWPKAFADALNIAPTIRVVGCGKASAAMAAALEHCLANHLERVVGIVNVPEGSTATPQRIRLNSARPEGSNLPTTAGVAGSEAMMKLFAEAEPNDVGIALISGGGSALLPLPAGKLSLDDKIAVTSLLSRAGATIQELNAVRKHLSAIKGGRLAAAFRGKLLLSLVLSDVIGDPLDVIASGPTVPDPTTFADAIAVLEKYDLWTRVPLSVREHVKADEVETPKSLPASVVNQIIGNNDTARRAAAAHAERLGYVVHDLGGDFAGDTQELAADFAQRVADYAGPLPACFLSGGETIVNLGDATGKGGRNTEFALAFAVTLRDDLRPRVVALSGGTDGEDGPTDAAGAVMDGETPLQQAREHLSRHDSYTFFAKVGGLIRTGLTETNVMDLRVILLR